MKEEHNRVLMKATDKTGFPSRFQRYVVENSLNLNKIKSISIIRGFGVPK